MVDDTDQNDEPLWLRTLPLRSEELGYAPHELIACSRCGRANAPDRQSCLYCGAECEGAAGTRLEIAHAEDWENGYNVILINADTLNDGVVRELASVMRVDEEFLRTVLESGKRLPILRVSSEDQAEAACKRLGELGIQAKVVDDGSLKASSPPVRLRSIGFAGDRLDLGLFNMDEVYPIDTDKIVLIVAGTFFAGTNESLERRKLRGAKLLNETTTLSDEPVIDIYSNNDPLGWRIPARGFDFSCLGAEKTFVVGENMKKLIAKLMQVAPEARLVDDYMSSRELIEDTWPSEVQRDRRVMNRKKVSTVVTTNNVTQFTKFSRMQWQLLYEEKVQRSEEKI